MARRGSLLLLTVLLCFLNQAKCDASSHTELYNKIKRLFEDKRVLETADQVRRDMLEEDNKRESDDGLISELKRLLNENKEERSENEKEEERRMEEEKQERGEGLLSELKRLLSDRDNEEEWEREEENRMEENYKDPIKRILIALRTEEQKKLPWYKLKEEAAAKTWNEQCYFMKNKQYLEDMAPKECIPYRNKKSRPCFKFCDTWTKAIEEQLGYKGCKYDSLETDRHCSNKYSDKCSNCKFHNSEVFSRCCGWCYRKCCKYDSLETDRHCSNKYSDKCSNCKFHNSEVFSRCCGWCYRKCNLD